MLRTFPTDGVAGFGNGWDGARTPSLKKRHVQFQAKCRLRQVPLLWLRLRPRLSTLHFRRRHSPLFLLNPQ